MNNIQKSLIDLLASAINGDKLSIPELSDDEWYDLFEEAKEHGVQLLITYALKKQNVLFNNKNLIKSRMELLFITTLSIASSISIVEELLDKFKKNGIEVMVLKGYYFKTLYPNPSLRVMGDVDFFVTKDDLNEVFKILSEKGYKHINRSHSDLHCVYIHPNYIPIEIHHSLMTDTFSKSQKTFEQLIWDERVVKNINSCTCVVPSEVNHAIYCFIHMINHLRSSGFGLRHLCDLVFLIKHVPTFGWDELFEKARKFRIHNFVVSILWICHQYLKLEIPDTYLSNIKPNEPDKIHMLFEDILQSGEFGCKDTRYTLNKKLAEYELNSSSFGIDNPISFIFPSSHKLSNVYRYAKKYPYLIPIAWIHRMINNITRSDLRLKDKLPNSKIMANHKELIKWLNKE